MSFSVLAGWAETDFVAAWTTFRSSAVMVTRRDASLRTAVPPEAALCAVCEQAAAMPEAVDGITAQIFFEQAFQPARIEVPNGGAGFVTGYYEPVVEGATVCRGDFTAPIMPRPADLRPLLPEDQHVAIPTGFSAGRLSSSGMELYPDRAAIEAFAVTAAAAPIVWLRDWTEVFLVHVQGSARVRLEDGSDHRLVYAGRNAHPYSSIGRRLIETGRIAQSDMSLSVLKSWLRAHGQETGQEARALMQENRSYIFFRMEPVGAVDHGPIGGQGLPLHALSSIAVDRSLWPYGLPFWIETTMPIPGFGAGPMAQLFIAQDTGSAILGPARADLFLGSGDEAGLFAGAIRHPAHFTVLLPRPA